MCKIINSISIFVKDLQYCHYLQPYGSILAITTMVTLLFMPSEECLAQNEYFGMKPQTLSYTHKLDRPTLLLFVPVI